VTDLTEFVPGRIWLREYPVRYAGTRFRARMTVLRLSGGELFIHSPCALDDSLRADLAGLGPVAHIVAPGTYHYFHVESFQRAFPRAETHICPGIERKRPEIHFDWILGDRPQPAWNGEIDQVLVRGTRFISEVVFFDRPSRTLLIVDLLENIGDGTPGTNWLLRFYWKAVLRMWNRPKPAPEYQLGWGNRAVVASALGRVLEWDFTRVVVAHGDVVETNAKEVVRTAWERPLRWASAPGPG
jgi:hypothetical protein